MPLELKYECWIIILPFSDLLLLYWPPLYIWLGCLQLWVGCDAGRLFWGGNTQQSAHTSHLSIYYQVYCCGSEKNCVYAFQPVSNSLVYRDYIICKWFDLNWSVIWVFNYMVVLHGKACVLINYWIGHFGQIVVMCHGLSVYWQNFPHPHP